MTLIGMVVVAAFLGVFALAILKLTPFYLEQMKIISILQDVKRNLDSNGPTMVQIRNALEKRLDIEMVTGIHVKEIAIKKSGNGYLVQAKYERRAAYLGNIYLVAMFDEQVEIHR
jgi:hypothetical protein